PPSPPPPTPTPPPESLPPPVRKRIVLRGVNFDFDKTAIRPDSRPLLDEAVALLQENPRVLISVEGHTDAVGTELYNERLSVRRAEAVFRYLVNHGVAPERMQVVGYGESRPLAANTTAQGRAQNRRVELHVVKQPQASEP
ncbi:MAG: OmpA family protein, partial [Candidatus Binatia bacterium]